MMPVVLRTARRRPRHRRVGSASNMPRLLAVPGDALALQIGEMRCRAAPVRAGWRTTRALTTAPSASATLMEPIRLHGRQRWPRPNRRAGGRDRYRPFPGRPRSARALGGGQRLGDERIARAALRLMSGCGLAGCGKSFFAAHRRRLAMCGKPRIGQSVDGRRAPCAPGPHVAAISRKTRTKTTDRQSRTLRPFIWPSVGRFLHAVPVRPPLFSGRTLRRASLRNRTREPRRSLSGLPNTVAPPRKAHAGRSESAA